MYSHDNIWMYLILGFNDTYVSINFRNTTNSHLTVFLSSVQSVSQIQMTESIGVPVQFLMILCKG